MATSPRKAITEAEAPAPHVPRTTQPRKPAVVNPHAQQVVEQIYYQANAALSASTAIDAVRAVRVLNLDPAVGVYKTEMLEYLSTLKD